MRVAIACLCLGISSFCFAEQDTTILSDNIITSPLPKKTFLYAPAAYNGQSPYKTSWKVDGPVIAGSLGLTLVGYNLIINKGGLTATELASRKKENIPFFDRGNAGFYSDKANDASYIPFFVSFGAPIVASFLSAREREHWLQVNAMFLEAMSISGAIYTLSAGTISRSRPLVYGSSASFDSKTSNNSQRSFFAGHVSATATATFFAAQVFSDFHPDSRGKTIVWVAAATIPAVVGYLRYQAGQHFLSDIIIGYGVGMGVGILVPKLHRTKLFKSLRMSNS